ncbi:Flp family type IVb pilin [Acetobacter orientalis]|uniref:Flp family type IVb pilin n=1 Tax=Acetobacter orientalis TaxID=146474 RepID=UPI00209DAFE9|nr:Flp family type IVb pilin [Acetobacter orientalis]MCP1215081.1 Flp family type IVb pilin [Acetobacter orientalis]MCP1218664.1 Flp family type IVb pilin [Acetobacter orientalis]
MILKKVKNEIGATAIEYGLIASLVAVVAISGISAVGVNLKNTYCTISTHLGGSGNCSGSKSSSSTQGNSGVSLADGASLDDLQKSLSDKLDASFADTSIGGTASMDPDGPWDLDWSGPWDPADYAGKLADSLQSINSSDPITNVLGLYNHQTSNPLSSYSDALNALKTAQAGGNRDNTPSDGEAFASAKGWPGLEVTTASGKVYTLYAPNGDTSVTVTEASAK